MKEHEKNSNAHKLSEPGICTLSTLIISLTYKDCKIEIDQEGGDASWFCSPTPPRKFKLIEFT